MAKKPTIIDSGKFISNAMDRDAALSLCKRYERLFARIMLDGEIHELHRIEHAACRNQLAEWLGVRDQRRDALGVPGISYHQPTLIGHKEPDATRHEPSLPLEPAAPDAHLEADYEDRWEIGEF